MPIASESAHPPQRLLIQHADWLVTMDPTRRIVAVGRTDALAASFQADKVIDATGKLLMIRAGTTCFVDSGKQFLTRFQA